MKALIVGSGLAGMTAGVLLKRKGWGVTVMETRPHFGGNCADVLSNGIYVHTYGPHIFHTNDERVFRFLSEFTTFTDYQHKVMALSHVHDKPVPIPYGDATEEALGRKLTDQEIREAFFVKYTEKMWGCKYDQVPASITGRVSLRRPGNDTRYFLDRYQGMPNIGYTHMFMNMADEIGRCNINLGCRLHAWRSWEHEHDLLVFTGMLDEFYDHTHGKLPYRAISFWIRRAQPPQPYAVLNFCYDIPATRITDFGKFYDDKSGFTVTCEEYPQDWTQTDSAVPSYPMRGFPHADEKLAKYEALTHSSNVILAGRLGAYKYMNMDAVVSDTITKLETRLGEKIYA
jgi:UDP-galactopyranose mutase